MVSKVTLRCDCGTDICTDPPDGTVTCPNCELTFVTTITTLTPDHDARRYRQGSHSYCGP
ncbi:hypothetical protein AArc1_0274 [Natrarchaeobaculum sulfurireducens]|uniref:Uncharacterized protein n=1 Tax=Natrarchaeobaculum sulfurireducens TaxID=2044521 RepID=A0A346PAS3_9EURY|nr:hypothetical protein AArc1_0274 [Natrarchaeobaculum sulfurireducens]